MTQHGPTLSSLSEAKAVWVRIVAKAATSGMLKLALATLAGIVPSLVHADHDKLRYNWPEKAFLCREFGRALSDAEFLAAAVHYDNPLLFGSKVDAVLQRTKADWSVERRDNVWSKRADHMGFLGRLFATPTILVTFHNGWTIENRAPRAQYLMNRCGGVKDRLGKRFEW